VSSDVKSVISQPVAYVLGCTSVCARCAARLGRWREASAVSVKKEEPAAGAAGGRTQRQ
jgi:hypothetical protein